MNNFKYFFQFIGIIFLFFLYKLIGLKYSSVISGFVLSTLGPIFRSNKLSYKNLLKAFPDLEKKKTKKNY